MLFIVARRHLRSIEIVLRSGVCQVTGQEFGDLVNRMIGIWVNTGRGLFFLVAFFPKHSLHIVINGGPLRATNSIFP